MRYSYIYRFVLILITLSLSQLQACGGGKDDSSAAAKAPAPGSDIIAMVDDQAITYTELNTMLNSSAMVGLSIPMLGSPERQQVLITLLDKVISANLIYLDARDSGMDRLTAYQQDIKTFEDALIGDMYRKRVLIGDLEVTDEEIRQYFGNDIVQEDEDAELTDDLKLMISSKLRKQKYDERKATSRERLREGVNVVINEDIVATAHDGQRSAADTVAMIDDNRISWKDIETQMRGADYRASLATFYVDNDEERLDRLQQYIDNRLLAMKGREAGLDDMPIFKQRSAEFRKTRLINTHRGALYEGWQPSDDELKTYYVEHMDKILVPEQRKLQMVVLETKEEAEKVKEKIDNGEITIFQAAKEYSIDPRAKVTLGELGWVSQGTGFMELDDFTFNLEPETISEPVESPAGWHLIKVQEVVDAQRDSFEDPQTKRAALRLYMQEKFNDYVVDLRKNKYDVNVYDDVLAAQFQEDIDLVAELSKKAQEAGSVSEQRKQELEKYLPPSTN